MIINKKIKMWLLLHLFFLMLALFFGSYLAREYAEKKRAFADTIKAVETLELLISPNLTSPQSHPSLLLDNVYVIIDRLSREESPLGVSGLWVAIDDPKKGFIGIHNEYSSDVILNPEDYVFSKHSDIRSFVYLGKSGKEYYITLKKLTRGRFVLGAIWEARTFWQKIIGTLVHIIPTVSLVMLVIAVLLVSCRRSLIRYFEHFDQLVDQIIMNRDITAEDKSMTFGSRQIALINRIKDMHDSISELLGVLRVEKEKSEVALKSIAEGIVIVGNDGRIISLNNMAESIIGYCSNDVAGKDFSSVIKLYDLETKEPLTSPVEMVLQKKEIIKVRSNLMLLLENEQEIALLLSASPVMGEDGEISEVIIVLRDITAEILKNESLENSNQMLKTNAENMQLIFEVAKIASWEYDLKNQVVYAEPEFYELLHVSQDSFVNIHSDILPRVKNQEVLTNIFINPPETYDERFSVRLSVEGDDGICRWVLCSGRINVQDHKSNVRIMRGIIVDVTEEEYMHEELETQSRENRISNKRLQQVYDVAKLYFWEYDNKADRITGDDNFISAISSQLGLGEGEKGVSLGRIYSCIQPAYLDAVIQTIRLTMDKGDSNCTVEYATKPDQDGIARYMRNYINIEYNEQEEFCSAYGAVFDITQVHEQQARSLHRSKMESIGALSGGIAHDFNNIISGIVGMADLIDMKASGASGAFGEHCDKVRTCCRNIKELCERADEFTRKLLSFSRKKNVSFETLNLKEVVENTAIILKHSITKRIIVEFYSCIKDPVVIGNVAELQTSILNLGINARDAITEKSESVGSFQGRIDISLLKYEHDLAGVKVVAGKVDRNQDYVLLKVMDNGTGILQEDIKRILEPFYTTKTEDKGTGLGLSLISETVTSHNGALGIHSVYGTGTEFMLILPLVNSDAESPESSSMGTVAPVKMCADAESGEKSGEKKKILVVDDEPVMRVIYEQLLREQGYDVVVAENGKEGVDKYVAQQQDILGIIMDLQMPEMDGRDAFKNILEVDASARAVFVSGYLGEASSQELLDIGAIAVLSKPFRKRSFVQTIMKYFELQTY